MPSQQVTHSLLGIDDGVFELLVRYYLKSTRSELRELIALGINEEEKPVPTPVDNMVFIDGDPPRAIYVASTTFAIERLRAKWLGNTNKKGDIGKAVNSFEDLREKHSDIQCVLYLATNRPFKSKNHKALHDDAVTAIRDANIESHILEFSIFADFLEDEPAGQYFGEKYLQIPAQRMGLDLLRDIAHNSFNRHEVVYPLLIQPASEIQRDVEDSLLGCVDIWEAHIK